MTIVGAGGVEISGISYSGRFKKAYKKLASVNQDRADSALKKLMKKPMPPGIKFEKLEGYKNPDLYSIHVTGNFKISMEIVGGVALLRNIGTHKIIDRNP